MMSRPLARWAVHHRERPTALTRGAMLRRVRHGRQESIVSAEPHTIRHCGRRVACGIKPTSRPSPPRAPASRSDSSRRTRYTDVCRAVRVSRSHDLRGRAVALPRDLGRIEPPTRTRERPGQPATEKAARRARESRRENGMIDATTRVAKTCDDVFDLEIRQLLDDRLVREP